MRRCRVANSNVYNSDDVAASKAEDGWKRKQRDGSDSLDEHLQHTYVALPLAAPSPSSSAPTHTNEHCTAFSRARWPVGARRTDDASRPGRDARCRARDQLVVPRVGSGGGGG